MLYGYISKDSHFNEKYKKAIRSLLSKNISIGFNEDAISLNKVINKNLHEMMNIFFNTINIENNYDSEYEYVDYEGFIARLSIFTSEFYSKIYAFLVILRHTYFNPSGLYIFKNGNQVQQVIFLETFLNMFNIDENHIVMTHEAKDEFILFCELFDIDSNFALIEGDNIRNVFEHVNLKAKEIRKLLNSNLVKSRNSDINKTIKIDFHNNKYFGTKQQMDDSILETITINFGINDTTDYTLEILESLLDSTFELEVVRTILKNNLFIRTIDPNLESLENLLNDIATMKLDTISNNKSLRYRFQSCINDRFEESIKSLVLVQKDSGFESVIIKTSEFGYWIDEVTLVRRKLSDEETDNYIKNNIMIQKDIFKIKNLYYSYQEAFNEVKSLYAKDEIVVTFRVKSNNRSGIIQHFEKNIKI
jgi:hypothetical protein